MGRVLPFFTTDEELTKFSKALIDSQLDFETEMKADLRDIELLGHKETPLIMVDLNLAPIEDVIVRLKTVPKIVCLLIVPDDYANAEKLEHFFFLDRSNVALPQGEIRQYILKRIHQICKKIGLEKELIPQTVQYKGKPLMRISIDLVLEQQKAMSDIYIQLMVGKFVKLVKAGDDVDKESIQGYKEKGQTHLYQSKEDFERELSSNFQDLSKKLAEKAPLAKKLALELASIKQVQEAIRMMGVNESAMKLTDDMVDSIKKNLRETKSLGKLVDVLFQSKGVPFTRAALCNYLLGGLAEEIDWDSKQTLKKLIYASVFCDHSFLAEEQQLANIIRKTDPLYESLSDKQKQKIELHPQMSSEFLKNSGSFLTDETTIIEMHHEKPDGSGFPKGHNYNQIPSMACAFILVYDFTAILLEEFGRPEDIDPELIFEKLGPDYGKANFYKPYLALRKALKLKP